MQRCQMIVASKFESQTLILLLTCIDRILAFWLGKPGTRPTVQSYNVVVDNGLPSASVPFVKALKIVLYIIDTTASTVLVESSFLRAK